MWIRKMFEMVERKRVTDRLQFRRSTRARERLRDCGVASRCVKRVQLALEIEACPGRRVLMLEEIYPVKSI